MLLAAGAAAAAAAVVGRARILATACSATIMMAAVGLLVTWPGKMEASTTKRLSVP